MKDPVDAHVGARIRHRRWMVGMTQQELADKIGVKFQQIQKYETGMNRVSASRLHKAARAMQVPTAYFFAGLEGEADLPDHTIVDKEMSEMNGIFSRMEAAPRRHIFNLARTMVGLPTRATEAA